MGGFKREPRGRLAGRQRELDLLAGALERAGELGTAVSLTGEAGIGKTRLATELADRAQHGGALVAWARAWDTGGAPAFWPFTQVLRRLLEQIGTERLTSACGDGLNHVARILPALSEESTGGGPPPDVEGDRFDLFDAISTTLCRLSRTERLVVVFDDLHAVDDASVELVEFLVRSLGVGDSVLVVACAEADDAAPPLSSLLGLIAREHTSIQLARLGPEAISDLCAELLAAPPSAAVLDTVMDASEGNPFFAIEVLRMIQVQDEPHRPDHSRGFRVPRGAHELLDERLSRVSEEVRLVLSVGAVIGREFDAAAIAEASSTDIKVVHGSLEEAVRAGLVKEISSLGRFGFSHVMLREALYENLAMSDRMRLHAAVAIMLERRYGDDLDHHVEEVAHHYYKAAQAGDKTKTLEYAVRAAQRATAKMAYEEATRLYERALKVAELAGTNGSRRAQIASALARSREMAAEPGSRPLDSGAIERNLLLREGDYWTIAFNGNKFRIRDTKGLHYLAQLIRNPGREISALNLVGLVAGGPVELRRGVERGSLIPAGGDLGEVLDAEAKAAYKTRLIELEEEIETARAFNDDEKAARARVEIEALVDQLSQASGLGGRTRKIGADAERARTSVTKAIKSAVRRITAADEALGRHLEVSLRTGLLCTYSPDTTNSTLWSVR